MIKNPLKSCAGFTYVAAIVMVVIMGIMLSQAAQYWSLRMRREREAEIIYKGTQMRDAYRRAYGLTLNGYGAYLPAGATAPTVAVVTTIPANAIKINEPKDLLKSPSSLEKKRFARPSDLLVKDPATGKVLDWSEYKDVATGRTIGVYIKSDSVPIKQDFSDQPYLYPDDFVKKKKYSDWVFICTRYPKPPVAGGVKGLGGTSIPAVP
jgi:type II secretory pathway pseudopilin PulG